MRMRMALTVMRMMMAMMMFQLSGFCSSACGVGMNCEGLGNRVYLYPPLSILFGLPFGVPEIKLVSPNKELHWKQYRRAGVWKCSGSGLGTLC